MRPLEKARAIALFLPLALMAGALGSQYIGGLFPCEMCLWQRWPHYAAIALATLAFASLPGPAIRALIVAAGLAIAISGAIGLFHAGVEYGWWEGLTTCSVAPGSGGDTLAEIMATPLIRCDEPQWALFGISLAGFNGIFSLAGAAAIFWLASRTS